MLLLCVCVVCVRESMYAAPVCVCIAYCVFMCMCRVLCMCALCVHNGEKLRANVYVSMCMFVCVCGKYVYDCVRMGVYIFTIFLSQIDLV